MSKATQTLMQHWPEYLMEAAGLGLFMISASVFGALLEHPASPVRQALGDPLLRRTLMGFAMGGTAIAIIFSPWGKQSGAHINPSVTLTFLRLGKVAPWDAVFYILFQFLGATAGMFFAATTLRQFLAHPTVNYVATLPGPSGAGLALLAEVVISFMLMSVVLRVSNTRGIARYTGIFAGALVAIYITLESPISGMSMNPARTFGSAVTGHIWNSLWIYFVAPPLGMLLAAEVYRRPVGCAKLHHQNNRRCIHCGYGVKTQTPTKMEEVCIAR
jgi:aquaporin Z